MNDAKRFGPTTRTLLWGSGLIGLLVTINSGWVTPIWDGLWAYVGIPVGFIRKALLVGALTFVVLLVLREIIERSWRNSEERQ